MRLRGHGKLLPASEPRIRIRFDDIDLAIGSKAHVNASVISQLQSAIRGQSRILQPLPRIGIQIFGDLRFGQLVNFAVLFELDVVACNARSSLGQAR